MLSVLILAGGQATRLRGIWDGPKCLVPVGGRPLLGVLLDLISPLKPSSLAILLGYRAAEVIAWAAEHANALPKSVPPPHFIPDRGPFYYEQMGTYDALKRGLNTLHNQVLVLNGDTIPQYDLASLVQYHTQPPMSYWATATFCSNPGTGRAIYAGAIVLSPRAACEIREDPNILDFASVLLGAHRYYVPGFLDVGTRSGFEQAQSWKDE